MCRTRKTTQFFRRNASILEAFLAFFILLLICFGCIQLYKLTVANMVTEYAAFRGARSSAVGFDDYLVSREARIKAIPASGKMIEPESSLNFDSPQAQFSAETIHAELYMTGERWINYEYWSGGVSTHTNYKCPLYGSTMSTGLVCSTCVKGCPPSFSISQTIRNNETTVDAAFHNYPLTMPLYDLFTRTSTAQIEKSATLTNHAAIFLDE